MSWALCRWSLIHAEHFTALTQIFFKYIDCRVFFHFTCQLFLLTIVSSIDVCFCVWSISLFSLGVDLLNLLHWYQHLSFLSWAMIKYIFVVDHYIYIYLYILGEINLISLSLFNFVVGIFDQYNLGFSSIYIWSWSRYFAVDQFILGLISIISNSNQLVSLKCVVCIGSSVIFTVDQYTLGFTQFILR